MVRKSSKGVSTVIGTVFFVLIVLMVATNVFLWSLMQSSLYNLAVKENQQIEADRFSERIATSRTNYTIPQTGTVQVDLTVSNEGPVSAQIITAWVVWTVEGETKYGFNDTLNINLNPRQSFPLTTTVAIPNANSTGAFSGWLITARGNRVSLEKEKMVVHSQVALGIGSVMMDFDRFKHYIYDSKTETLSGWPEGYINFTLPKEDLVFGVLLSNYDQYRRTITLDERSMLWIYFAKDPGHRPTWPITNVASNGTILETYTPISLAYGESKWIFFGETTQTGSGAGAVNLILLGKIDGQDYGQNIPFVSIYVTS